MSFHFQGATPPSKSLMNRALIAQSYAPHLQIRYENKELCTDILDLKKALKEVSSRTEVDCGQGGTTFRFLALRVARIPGEHFLSAHPRLLERPHEDLLSTLKQLGVKTEMSSKGLKISTQGFQKPLETLQMSRAVSSQFASALLLNSWDLDFQLRMQLSYESVSDDYFEMTLRFCRELGLKILESGNELSVAPGQKVLSQDVEVEMDLSSLFPLAVAATLDGTLKTEHFPIRSLQPDSQFVGFLSQMGVPHYYSGHVLEVQKASSLKPLKANLQNCPDLFPVLSALCAFAPGVSELEGAPHLAFKESDRIRKSRELLSLMGIKTESVEGGMRIYGGEPKLTAATHFDPDHDHRMAMAAAIFMLKGFPIRVTQPQVVQKSFPSFWQSIGVKP